MSNTTVSAGGVTVSDNWHVSYHPDTAIFIDLAYETDAVVSVESAKALRDGLTKIIDAVEARKPVELKASEKIAKLANGTGFNIHTSSVSGPSFFKVGNHVFSLFGTKFTFDEFDGVSIYVDGKAI